MKELAASPCILRSVPAPRLQNPSAFQARFKPGKEKSIWSMKQHVQLPGATMISCFFDLIRRKVRSFWGSMSRTVLLAFMVSWWSRPAYWTVVELSRVVRIGMPVMRCNLELRSSGLSGRCTHCKIYWRSLILTDGEKLTERGITGWHQF